MLPSKLSAQQQDVYCIKLVIPILKLKRKKKNIKTDKY